MNSAFFALVRKDIRLFFGNRRAMLVSVAAPIAIASFFGYVFNSVSSSSATR